MLGEYITVPDNCVLEFDGGSLSGNGTGKDTITGTNTQIIAQDVAIFNNGIVIAGTWICPRIPSDWFGDVTSDNRIKQLINLSSASVDNHIIVKEGIYTVSISTNDTAVIYPKSNTILEIFGSIQLTPNAFANAYIMEIADGVENVKVTGTGELVGDYLLGHTGSTGEWSHGIFTFGCKNIEINGITIRNCWGDGISIGGSIRTIGRTEGITISCCHIHTCRRLGISVIYAKRVLISQNYINNIFGTSPQAAIDVECDANTDIYGVVIENNTIENKCGIEVTAVANNMRAIVIRDNMVMYSKYYGIGITSGVAVEVINNRLNIVPLAQTNPTDDDSTASTPVAISSEMSDAVIKGNSIEGGDHYSMMIKGSHVENNWVYSALAKFENADVYSNRLFISGIISKGSRFRNNRITTGYINWGFGIEINNGSEFDGNEFIDGYTLTSVIYSGTEPVIFRNNIIKNSNPVKLLQNNFAGANIIFEDNIPAVNYTDGIIGLPQAANLKATFPAPNKGATADRPTLGGEYGGHKYFDTTLGKEILWNGSAWVNVDGSALS